MSELLIEMPDLRRELARRAWTVSELSERSGCSRNTLSLAVRGRPVAARTARRVIDALRASPAHDEAFAVGARAERGVGEAPVSAGDLGS